MRRWPPAYEQVLTYATDDFLSWESRGQALVYLGRIEEALAAYEQTLTFRPDIANVWRKKAEVLRALGREVEAQEADQRAEELE
jgi:tetratricopeptide (TPR) repeat protein